MSLPNIDHPSQRSERIPAADRWQTGVVVAVLVMAVAWILVYATVMDESAEPPHDHVRFAQPVKNETPGEAQSAGPGEVDFNARI
jgi:hypothetical protein